MPSTIAAAPEDTADDAAASSAPVGTNTEVPTAETAAKSVDETQESANVVAAEDDTPPENPVEKYVRPWSIAVGYDKLHFYYPTDLVATRMYSRPAVLPIVLLCMGYSVRGFPTDLSKDDIISKTSKRHHKRHNPLLEKRMTTFLKCLRVLITSQLMHLQL